MTNNQMEEAYNELLHKMLFYKGGKLRLLLPIIASFDVRFVEETGKIACHATNKNSYSKQEIRYYIDFFKIEEEEAKLFIIIHEMIHAIEQHAIVCIEQKLDNKEVLNIALDLYINCFIKRIFGLSTELGQWPANYHLPDDKDYQFYYHELMKNPPSDGKENSHDIHDWKEIESISDVERDFYKQLSSNYIENVCKKNAIGVGGLNVNTAVAEIKTASVNWRQTLRLYIGKTLGDSIRRSYLRTDRRSAGIQRAMPTKGVLNEYNKKSILFAYDSSGSMSDDDISQALSDVQHTRKEATVSYVAWDGELGDIKSDREKVVFSREKSGGTSLMPLLNEWNKKLCKSYDLLIVFTDGFIGGETFNPKGQCCIIITKNGSKNGIKTNKLMIQVN